ncbi:MAG TPA: DUF1330 domain-containing protein [Asticcacaulis sp.]
MPKAYLIAQASVSDPDAYARYVAGTKAAFEKYGARPLARGGRTEVMEGQGRPRVVVLEFADLDTARAYYHSAEYQAAKQERLGAADFDSIIVEGVA